MMAKSKKLKPITELGMVDFYGEWNKPFKVVKFYTYIYATKPIVNPNSEIEVRCDLWFNRPLSENQFCIPEDLDPDEHNDITNYIHKRVEHNVAYFTRCIVDIDDKTVTLTEGRLNGVTIIGIDNIDDVINRNCTVLSGMKE